MLYRQFYFEHIADSTSIYPGVLEGLDAFREGFVALRRHQQMDDLQRGARSNTLI